MPKKKILHPPLISPLDYTSACVTRIGGKQRDFGLLQHLPFLTGRGSSIFCARSKRDRGRGVAGLAL